MKKITLLFFLSFCMIGFSQNLVSNGDFETGDLTGWGGNSANGGSRSVVDDGSGSNNVAEIIVANAGASWQVGIDQVIPLTQDETYRVTYTAYADAPRNITAGIGQAGGTFQSSVVSQAITTTPTVYMHDLVPNYDTVTDNARVIFDLGDIVSTVYIDNVSVELVAFDPNTDATLSDLTVNGMTVAGFDPNTFDYNVQLPNGTTMVPTVVGTPTQMAAGAVTNDAAGLPGTTTVTVTAGDMTTTQDYTLNFTVAGAGPSVPSPTPPQAASNVISIFSETYPSVSSLTPTTFGVNNNTAAVESAAGNDVYRLNSVDGVFQGFFIDTPVDLTEIENLHYDLWIPSGATTVAGAVFNTNLTQAGSPNIVYSDTNALGVPTQGTWLSFDVPLSDFIDGGSGNTLDTQTRDNITEIVFTYVNTIANGESMFVDNIYFWSSMVLSNDEFETADFRVFPNPTNSVWNLSSANTITNVGVYDILGKQVISISPNSNEATIDASSLRTGVYFARIDGINGSKTVKLVRE
ncbi:T9SS type A sorting domain-containing protein [Winogradskyella tangerina]|uniref:T9SS type A sorting domain-containing protein n=1 Tax=Winogradskyella tangerina TaxID=2023240 RepID=UPI000DBE9292|nr:T9SS type A sorting domain-containing protein [Winogradskyella tangerina]